MNEYSNQEFEEVNEWLGKQGLAKYAQLLNLNGIRRFNDCFALTSDALKMLGINDEREIEKLLILRRQKRVPVPVSPPPSTIEPVCRNEQPPELPPPPPPPPLHLQPQPQPAATGVSAAQSGSLSSDHSIRPVKGIHITDMIHSIEVKNPTNPMAIHPIHATPNRSISDRQVRPNPSNADFRHLDQSHSPSEFATTPPDSSARNLTTPEPPKSRPPIKNISAVKRSESVQIKSAQSSKLQPLTTIPAHDDLQFKQHVLQQDTPISSQQFESGEPAANAVSHAQSKLDGHKNVQVRLPGDNTLASLELIERHMLPVNIQIRTLIRDKAKMDVQEGDAHGIGISTAASDEFDDSEDQEVQQGSSSKVENEKMVSRNTTDSEDSIDGDTGSVFFNSRHPSTSAQGGGLRPAPSDGALSTFIDGPTSSFSQPLPKTLNGFLNLLPGGVPVSGKFWAVFNGKDLRLFKNEKASVPKRIVPVRLIEKVMPLTTDRSQFLLMLPGGQFPFEVVKGEENKHWFDVLDAAVKAKPEAVASTAVTDPRSSVLSLELQRASKEGWVTMEKRGFLTSAARSRFYIVITGGILRYYNSPEEKSVECPINEIRMELATVKYVMTAPNKIDRTKLRLVDACVNVPFILSFESTVECEEWHKALQNAILVALDKGTNDNSHTKTLKAIYENPSNRNCADCGASDPEWASINMGIMICENCAGCHRQISVSYSKVQSVRLDTRVWTNTNIKIMTTIGNANANKFWEGLLPSDFIRSALNFSREKRADFIRNKYVEKRYCAFHPSHGDETRLNEELCEVIRDNDKTLIEAMELLFSGASVIGTINAETYKVQCLQKRLLPFLRKHNLIGRALFLPDLATSHYAGIATEFLKRHKIRYAQKVGNTPYVPESCEQSRATVSYMTIENGLPVSVMQLAKDKKRFLLNEFFLNNQNVVTTTQGTMPVGPFESGDDERPRPQVQYSGNIWKCDKRLQGFKPRHAVLDGIRFAYDKEGDLKGYFCSTDVTSLFRDKFAKYDHCISLFTLAGDTYRQYVIASDSLPDANGWFDAFYRSCCPGVIYRQLPNKSDSVSTTESVRKAGYVEIRDVESEPQQAWMCLDSQRRLTFYLCSTEPRSRDSPIPISWLFENRKLNLMDITVEKLCERLDSPPSGTIDLRKTITCDLYTSTVPSSFPGTAPTTTPTSAPAQKISLTSPPLLNPANKATTATQPQQQTTFYILTISNKILRITCMSAKDTENWLQLIKKAMSPTELKLNEQALSNENVPIAVSRCCAYVRTHGVNLEGIYRKTGVESNVKALVEALLKNPNTAPLPGASESQVHEVATALRRYLRLMDDSLLMNKLHSSWMRIPQEASTNEARIRMYKDILKKLDPVHHATVHTLCLHLAKVVDNSSVNKMSLENLATVFVSVFFGDEANAELLADPSRFGVMMDLIRYHNELFVIEAEIEERIEEAIKKLKPALEGQNSPSENVASTMKLEVSLTDYPNAGDRFELFLDVEASTNAHSFISLALTTLHNHAPSQPSLPEGSVLPSSFVVIESLLEGKLVRPLRNDELILQTALGWSEWLPNVAHHRLSPKLRIRRDFRATIHERPPTTAAAQSRPSAAQCLTAGEKKDLRKCQLRLDDDGTLVLTPNNNQSLTFSVLSLNVYEGVDPERVSNAARFYVTLIERSRQKNTLTTSSFTNLLGVSSKSNIFVGIVICFQTDAERSAWLNALRDAQARLSCPSSSASAIEIPNSLQKTNDPATLSNSAPSVLPSTFPKSIPHRPPPPPPRSDSSALPAIPIRMDVPRRAPPPIPTLDAHHYVDLNLPNFNQPESNTSVTPNALVSTSSSDVATDFPCASASASVPAIPPRRFKALKMKTGGNDQTDC